MYFKVNFISTFFNNKKQGKKVHRDRIKSDTHNARKYRINSILSYLLIDYFSLSFFFGVAHSLVFLFFRCIVRWCATVVASILCVIFFCVNLVLLCFIFVCFEQGVFCHCV